LLRRNLTDYFRDGELRALCSELGIEYARLRGQSRAARAGDLIRLLTARHRLAALVALAVRRRPDISWGDLPTDLAPPSDLASKARGPSGRSVMLKRLGWLAAGLIAVGGLVVLLSGGLRPSRPAMSPTLALDTPRPAPTATPQIFTPTPSAVAMTATPQWTAVSPTETALPTASGTTTRLPQPSPTLTPTARVDIRIPRTATLLTPVNGVCEKSTAVTFKWTGAILGPGEAFLVVVAPSEVYRAKCTGGSVQGVRISSPVTGYEWTADLSSTSPQISAACAGMVEWTVYISNPAGNIQAAPWQVFEWNPLRCQ
jgi:hypothetical protein